MTEKTMGELRAANYNYSADIAEMNAMYRLSLPSLANADIKKRLDGFKKTLQDELKEIDDILVMCEESDDDLSTKVKILKDSMDVFADLSVFTHSEAAKFTAAMNEYKARIATATDSDKIHFNNVLREVMRCNFTKKWPDPETGEKYQIVKYDENGKFIKGPDTEKPDLALSLMVMGCILPSSNETN
jgi:hypothetical protein